VYEELPIPRKPVRAQSRASFALTTLLPGFLRGFYGYVSRYTTVYRVAPRGHAPLRGGHSVTAAYELADPLVKRHLISLRGQLRLGMFRVSEKDSAMK
jgi:hypothetical protein